MRKDEFKNYHNIYDFIKGSINYSIFTKMFSMDTDKNTNMSETVSDVCVVCKNKMFHFYITIGGNMLPVTTVDKLTPSSKAESYAGIFDDMLVEAMKSKDINFQKVVKTNFIFNEVYIVPMEFLLRRDYVFFTDDVKIEKQNSKIEKVIAYVKDAGETGRTQKDITLFIKNYKPELRKEVQDLLTDNDEIKVVKIGEGRKETTTYFYRACE